MRPAMLLSVLIVAAPAAAEPAENEYADHPMVRAVREYFQRTEPELAENIRRLIPQGSQYGGAVYVVYDDPEQGMVMRRYWALEISGRFVTYPTPPVTLDHPVVLDYLAREYLRRAYRSYPLRIHRIEPVELGDAGDDTAAVVARFQLDPNVPWDRAEQYHAAMGFAKVENRWRLEEVVLRIGKPGRMRTNRPQQRPAIERVLSWEDPRPPVQVVAAPAPAQAPQAPAQQAATDDGGGVNWPLLLIGLLIIAAAGALVLVPSKRRKGPGPRGPRSAGGKGLLQ